MKTITLKQLVDADACHDQRKLFAEMFGESVEITITLCESVANQFDIIWAARHLLSSSALDDYKRTMALAQADYEHARAPALADYERTMALAQTDYARTMALAHTDYARAMVPALADYKRVRAAAFAKAYLSME